MMKKKGFTLAEVLITLTIIGVIATLTLPTLMTNTAEQQYRTGLKKGINTLTEAAQMHEALEGFNYSSLTGESDVSIIDKNQRKEDGKEPVAVNGIDSLAGMLRERTKVDATKTTNSQNKEAANIAIGAKGGGSVPIGNPQIIHFQDSTALIFDDTLVRNRENTDGFVVVFDTNGTKGPNQLSNCRGFDNGGADTLSDKELKDGDLPVADIAECTKDNGKYRVIKDQFTLRIDGNVVSPEGGAAVWAFSN